MTSPFAMTDQEFADLEQMVEAARKLRNDGWKVVQVTSQGLSARLDASGIAHVFTERLHLGHVSELALQVRKVERRSSDAERWEIFVSFPTDSAPNTVIDGCIGMVQAMREMKPFAKAKP